jgi:putative membrane protein
MSETLQTFYPWLKAAHIIAVIAWMAGMLYLPRLFVYHCETTPGTSEYERFSLMERKLMRIIINPAMIAVWVFGLLLADTIHAWSQPWFHVKLLMVVILSGFHGMFSKWRRDFENGANTRTQRFYRIVNEVPAVLMMIIVVLVVVKPF